MLSNFKAEKILTILVLLTLVAALGERKILGTSKTITAQDGFATSVYSDAVAGGVSTAEITDADTLQWRCTLTRETIYPYCGFEVIFHPSRVEGLDLRNFDKMRIALDYRGPADSIRLYLRNFDPAYSDPSLYDSTKYNQVEFPVEMLNDGVIELDMADFFVANWWLQRYKLLPGLSHPQFDNIVVFEVQTGNNPPAGEHRFQLNAVELEGQRISSQHWYQIILGAWVVMAIIFLGIRSLNLNREVHRRRERERELMEVNSVLDMRSRVLEEMSKTDKLTGAFNRQGIEEAFRVGLLEWRRKRIPLSILILDVDHFKKINDTHGHAVGDRVLTGMADTVQNSIRSNDLFARWGGEEFVLVCRNTSIEEAQKLAEKLRRLLAAQDFGQGVAITVSIGVAMLQEQESLDHLLVRADEALYQAKRCGRNRVVVAGQAKLNEDVASNEVTG